jgi:hypothetical protein
VERKNKGSFLAQRGRFWHTFQNYFNMGVLENTFLKSAKYDPFDPFMTPILKYD